MKINKKLYRVLSSKGRAKGISRGFRVPTDFPLSNLQIKILIANMDLIATNKADGDVKSILKPLTTYLHKKRKELKKKEKNDS